MTLFIFPSGISLVEATRTKSDIAFAMDLGNRSDEYYLLLESSNWAGLPCAKHRHCGAVRQIYIILSILPKVVNSNGGEKNHDRTKRDQGKNSLLGSFSGPTDGVALDRTN
jgi:hypothetical protein